MPTKHRASLANIADPISRTPPANVRRLLRSEVGFGCPVPACNSPYLSWHHFDPPWAIAHHHNPDGIVALCVQHHGAADGGAFTNQQLHAFKDRRYNGRGTRLQGRLTWRRSRLFVIAGRNLWFG